MFSEFLTPKPSGVLASDRFLQRHVAASGDAGGGLVLHWLASRRLPSPCSSMSVGFGILIGNVPLITTAGLEIGIYEEGSVLQYPLQRCECRLVSASDLPRHRRQGTLGTDRRNPKLSAHRRCRTVPVSSVPTWWLFFFRLCS